MTTVGLIHRPSPEKSRMMAAIRTRNTAPELLVRRYLHQCGFRFRLNSTLQGRPDIVLPKYRCAIFVHGCFWHGHQGCPKARLPKTNTLFWAQKQADNMRRDAVVGQRLTEQRWQVITVWECKTRHVDYLERLVETIRGRTHVRLD